MAMYRIVTQFSGPAGTPWFSQMFFDDQAGTATNAADAVATFWGAVDVRMDDSVSWQIDNEVLTIDEVSGDVIFLSQVSGGSGGGTEVGDQAPTVLQALVQWGTGVPFDGRILRGRTFVPGLSETNLSNGELLEGAATIINDAATALASEGLALLVVWHRPIPPPDEEHPDRVQRDGAFAPVISANVPRKFAVLRSRRD